MITKENVILTDQQENAVNTAIKSVVTNNKCLSIGGYAGTGKTTVLKNIIKGLEDEGENESIPCAFTGKAALRMRQKGVYDACTIHSTIYHYVKDTNSFVKRPEVKGDFFIIDEASMIPSPLWKDILSYRYPIILVGDLGQLEPVGDDPQLMKSPNVILDKIHRQAQQSSIIQFATKVRMNESDRFTCQYNKNEVNIIRPRFLSDDYLMSADIIICAFNKTRIDVNTRLRRLKDISSPLPVEGDRIICLTNNQKIGCFNGEMFTIIKTLRTTDTYIECLVKPDADEEFLCKLNIKQFNNVKNMSKEGTWTQSKYSPNKKYFKPLIPDADKYMFADFGYCITCHKSQGSEWDKVLVIDEQCSSLWDAQRWRYTAITRAAKELIYVL